MDCLGLHVIVPTMNSGKSPSRDDIELVRRFIAGDRQAFDDLYRIHAPAALAFLAARVKETADAEDLLHDASLKAMKNCGTFDGKDFHAWFFQIARNTLYDFSKSPRQRSKRSGLDEEQEPGHDDDPSAGMSRHEELIALRDCIESVGGVFVEAVVRTQLNETSPEQLAKEIAVARATIDSRVSRGKQQLRDCLEKKLK